MKGICFIEPLFHKVVQGEKTQTRRIITNEDWMNQSHIRIELSDDNCFAHFISNNGGEAFAGKVAKYAPHEKVYLKEPYILYQEDYQESRLSQSGIQYAYKFGSNLSVEEITGKSDSKWKNKLFMPESAARYFIEITAVRAERLQDISDEDCLKEGIKPFTKDHHVFKYGIDGWCWSKMSRTAREAYAALIDKINGKGTWEKNPFVWVYDFNLIKK